MEGDSCDEENTEEEVEDIVPKRRKNDGQNMRKDVPSKQPTSEVNRLQSAKKTVQIALKTKTVNNDMETSDEESEEEWESENEEIGEETEPSRMCTRSYQKPSNSSIDEENESDKESDSGEEEWPTFSVRKSLKVGCVRH